VPSSYSSERLSDCKNLAGLPDSSGPAKPGAAGLEADITDELAFAHAIMTKAEKCSRNDDAEESALCEGCGVRRASSSAATATIHMYIMLYTYENIYGAFNPAPPVAKYE
jgi:hypothetical protein